MRGRSLLFVMCGTMSLTLGVLSPVVAARAEAPSTMPVISDPADGGSVSGVVEINATSSAPRVRFTVDDEVIGTVTTVGSAATQAWTSWGWAAGAHTLRAFDCDATDACNPVGGTVSVTLTVEKPTLTSPTPGALLSGPVAFTTVASGGGLAFYVDNVRRGFAASAPYRTSVDMWTLADGSHSVFATVCDVSGKRCLGASSAAVAFTAKSLHPAVKSLAPNPFSPNGDKVKDSTVATYYLPDIETVYASVVSAAGKVVFGPRNLGQRVAGTYTWAWNGLSNSGVRVPDGIYTVVLKTQRGTLYGQVTRGVRVDTVAPTIASVLGSGATFYPVLDGYRDTFTPTALVNEPSLLTLSVRNAAGTLVRTVSAYRLAGRVGVTWNGRNGSGVLVPAGTYKFTLTATDAGGNRRVSAAYTVYVSLKKLVATTFTVKVNASSRVVVMPSAACAYTRASQYGSTGVWLYNGCDYSKVGSQWLDLGFIATVPAAVTYGTVTLKAYGHTHGWNGYVPTVDVYGAINTSSGWVERTVTTKSATSALLTLVSAPGRSAISSARQVKLDIGVPNAWSPPPNEYDLAYLVLVVSAQVLR